MKEQVSSILDERYYEIDHPTGLKIFVMPKAHYRSAYAVIGTCLLYTSPSPRDRQKSRMPSSA